MWGEPHKGPGRARASPEKAEDGVEREGWQEEPPRGGLRDALVPGLGAGCSPWRQGWAQGCLAGTAGREPSLPPHCLTSPRNFGVKPHFPLPPSRWGAEGVFPHPGQPWLGAGE